MRCTIVHTHTHQKTVIRFREKCIIHNIGMGHSRNSHHLLHVYYMHPLSVCIDLIIIVIIYQCLNKDGVTIRINVSFQYRVRPGDLKYITEQFKDETGYTRVLHSTGQQSFLFFDGLHRFVLSNYYSCPEQTFSILFNGIKFFLFHCNNFPFSSGSSAIHDSCSRFNTSQFQAERGRFQEDLTSRLVDKFENLNCDVTDLQVQHQIIRILIQNSNKNWAKCYCFLISVIFVIISIRHDHFQGEQHSPTKGIRKCNQS